MNRNHLGLRLLRLAGLMACGGMALPAGAEAFRTQVIQLQRGWNAVFLEVHPAETTPAAVFARTPVDIAAAYYPPSSPAQFVTDPGVDLFKQAGWGVWYAEDRPDAFLRTLHAVYGQQAYLIHAQEAFTWTVTGTVAMAATRWQPDGFNFVGCSVRAEGGPTFAQFFSGSRAHRHNRIYRLVNGSWRRVSAPDAEAMRAGEAFWIYCRGGSSYQGPLGVETLTRQGLVLGATAASLTLRNHTEHPVTATIEHMPVGPNPVPLSIVIRTVGGPVDPVRSVAAPLPNGSWTQALPPLEGGAALRVPVEARLQDMRAVMHQSLLRITTDLGTACWVPVTGLRPDLEEK